MILINAILVMDLHRSNYIVVEKFNMLNNPNKLFPLSVFRKNFEKHGPKIHIPQNKWYIFFEL